MLNSLDAELSTGHHCQPQDGETQEKDEMRLAFRIPQTFYTLLTLLFLFGALSLSSIFHDESKPLIRMAIQAAIFSIALLLIVTAGAQSLRSALWGIPVTTALSVITNSQYPLHLFLLTLICLILIRRSENRETDSWAYAAWLGAITGLVIDIALGKLGISESKIYYVVTSETTKNSMGFFNPNIAALLSASTVIFSSLAKKRFAWLLSISLFAYVLSETYARTASIIIIIYYINTLVIYKFPTIIKRTAAAALQFTSLALVIFITFMDLAPQITQSDVFVALDKVLSYRLSLAMPNLEGISLLFPSEAPRNMDFALANIIVVFGGIPLMLFLTISIMISSTISEDRIDFFLMCNMICFASLFSENIAYIYIPIGIIFAVPFSYVIHYMIRTSKIMLTRIA